MTMGTSSSKLILLGTVLALVAVACAAPNSTSGSDLRDPGTATSNTIPPLTLGEGPAVTTFPEGPSALSHRNSDEFPEPLIDIGQIISGGPPPDGIPPIELPLFFDVVDVVDRLPLDEAVVALEINGDARAYPVRAMVWHEIVNDTVGGVPVSVTYCPLCNSAVTYERTIDGNVTTFGTSGLLFASALVMYDRATESLWTHFDGRAVVGVLTGSQLVARSSPLISWGDFIENYPTGKLLDWDATGFRRDYGRNPYVGYDSPDGTPFLFRGALDDRAAAMQRIVGISLENESVAYALEVVSSGEAKATNIDVDEAPLVIFWKAGQASALESVDLEGGRDVGSVGVFSRVVDGDTLTFTAAGDGFFDDDTGTRWSLTGDAVSGPLKGKRLDSVPHLDTFWFAWSTYQPETTLIDG
jgi:hypothetical protein